MATVERYVNTASTPGGDGTTNAEAGANRAYASQSEWEAAEQTDLVSDGDVHVVHCSTGSGTAADTTTVTVTGWTTGASNDITIQVDQDVRHNGAWDTTAYRLSAANSHILTVNEDYVALDGLQSEKTGSSANDQGCFYITSIGSPSQVTITNCIAKQAGNASYREPGFRLRDADLTVTVYNCVAYGGDGTVTHNNNSGIVMEVSVANVYNCTTDGFYRGIRRTSGTVTATNCLATGSGSTDFSGTMTATYCASEDATADDNGGAGNRISQTFLFVDSASGDYHLTVADLGARLWGTDLSGTFTTDIDGETRSGLWDIGADQDSVGQIGPERYVNTASSAGGNGSTNATAGDDRAYASLAEWEAAEQSDLVAASMVHTVHCEGSAADTGYTLISGWTTDAGDYIHIVVDQDVRHDGKWDASAYRMEVVGNYNIYALEGAVHVEGVQFLMSATSYALYLRAIADVADYEVDSCIFDGNGVSTAAIYAYTGAAGSSVKIWNSLFYDMEEAVTIDDADIDAYIQNVTVVTTTGAGRGLRNANSNSISAFNCLLDCTDAFYGTWVDNDAVNDYNFISEDNVGEVAIGSNGGYNVSFTYEDSGSDDYHLASGDTGALDQGTDLSAGDIGFSDDIDADTRSGTWDVGADEYVSAGGFVPYPYPLHELAGGIRE